MSMIFSIYALIMPKMIQMSVKGPLTRKLSNILSATSWFAVATNSVIIWVEKAASTVRYKWLLSRLPSSGQLASISAESVSRT